MPVPEGGQLTVCTSRSLKETAKDTLRKHGVGVKKPTQAGQLIGPAPGSEIRDPVSRGSMQTRRRSMLSTIARGP